MPEKVRIICNVDSLPVGARRFGGRDTVVYLSTDRCKGNVYLEPQLIVRELGKPLDSLSLDLSEIASYVYLADKAVPRGRFGTWTRNLCFFIPVRNLGRWNSVKHLLTNTVATLSGDNVQFSFFPRRREKSKDDEVAACPTPSNSMPSDCVCLFSGGLDSLAGAAYLIGKGRRPLFASHYVSELKRVQHNLIIAIQTQLDRKFGHHFQYRITSRRTKYTRHRFKARESSHRARSFLFLSLATVAAASHRLKDIFVCENGILAVNVPISDGRKGTHSTRHAHPLYLAYFNQLVNALYQQTFSVRNPFLLWTKGKEIKVLQEAGLTALIRNTVTCWGYPNQTLLHKGSNHCGYCIPCIVRRVSVIAAGLEEYDDNYVVDIFGPVEHLKEGQLRNLEDLAYFCQCIAAGSKSDLLYRYPEFAMVELIRNGSKDDITGKIISVYKAFANEFISAARERVPALVQVHPAALLPSKGSSLTGNLYQSSSSQ